MSSKQYDVFVSFRGEDTRNNFTRELFDGLHQKEIKTFKDSKMEVGADVWPELSKAIEDSNISVVVFSENFADSKWCLEELLKIFQCREEQGQVVVPVFYKIEPRVVRKQSGSYQNALAKHEQELGSIKVTSWRNALSVAANISGWVFGKYENDSPALIIKIVDDIWEKLQQLYPCKIEGLVENEYEHEKHIESLLKDCPAIGIWGMSGIGKTTTAKVLFAKIFPRYDSACFLPDVREESKRKGLPALRDRILFELLKEDSPKSNVVESPLIMRRLKSRKVLIVLDDVDNSKQLDMLCGKKGDLGPQSRLIITTKNRSMLKKRNIKIYKLEPWGREKSLELFSLKAFDERQPKRGYEDLSEMAVSYADGLPLALEVLGSHLHSESVEFWKCELKILPKYQKMEIHAALRVSYDGLDPLEKNTFLDIALFFKDEYKNCVEGILNACEFSATAKIKILEDKALITISRSNRIQMHDLLQQMGWRIVCEESDNAGNRSRLTGIEAANVLENNQGTSSIEGIKLDLSQNIDKDLHLKAKTLQKMSKLRLLQFFIPLGKGSRKVHLPRVPRLVSRNLRYFEWYKYPSKSLPLKFCAELLVEIHMRHSQVEELWEGLQVLKNLEGIDLSESYHLKQLPDLSQASKLRWVYLSGCEGLSEVHPSLLSSGTLISLILDRCKNLKSLQSEKHLKSLAIISVKGCTSLKEFSLSLGSIKMLDLSNAGIETFQLYISDEHQSNIMSLNLGTLGLKNLELELCNLTSLKELIIPGSKLVITEQKLHKLFNGLPSLQVLHLTDCWNLPQLPDNISVLSKLEELVLDGSSVESLPDSIQQLPMLEILSLKNCTELQCLPKLPSSISQIYADNCTSLVTVSTLKTFAVEMKGRMIFISFRNCTQLDRDSLDCITEFALLTMKSAIHHNMLTKSSSHYSRHNYNYVKVCFPGSIVPEKFKNGKNESSVSTITIELPPRSESNLRGLVLCAVISQSKELQNHGAKILCQCAIPSGVMIGNETAWHDEVIRDLNGDHVCLWCDPTHFDSVLNSYEPRVTFEFYVTNDNGERDGLNIGVKQCEVWTEHGSSP